MKHGMRIAAVGIVLAGGTVALATGASASSGARTITLTVHETAFHYSDVTPTGKISAGDSFQITDKLVQSGTKVGDDALDCVQVDAAENICTGTFTLTGSGTGTGTIQIQGISRNATESDTYTVVGGTGQFEHAGGTLTTKGDSGSAAGGTAVLRLS